MPYYRSTEGRIVQMSMQGAATGLKPGDWTQIADSTAKRLLAPPSRTTRTARGGMDPAALEALTKASAYYEPGGGFGKGVEAGLERERTQAMSSGMQSLVGSGLAGTTMAAGLGKKFAEEVGVPTRARIEETRAERLSAIDVLKAQLTQGASESAQQRALQEFIARMSSGTQLALGSMRAGGTSSPTIRSPATRYISQPQDSGGGDSWSKTGLPAMTGMGAATYGVSGGGGNLISDVDWERIQSLSGREPSGREIPAVTGAGAMDEYLKTYVPKPGDFSTFSWEGAG